MLAQVREKDIALFEDLSKHQFEVKDRSTVDLRILIPGFMISELRRGFEIGFMIVLPFLVIDMITATLTMSMGMMMLPKCPNGRNRKSRGSVYNNNLDC